MAYEKRAGSKQQVPDPATVYERAKPEAESGQGRLDNNKATPARHADRIADTVGNKQASRQLNADDVTDGRATRKPGRK